VDFELSDTHTKFLESSAQKRGINNLMKQKLQEVNDSQEFSSEFNLSESNMSFRSGRERRPTQTKKDSAGAKKELYNFDTSKYSSYM